jgi:site-specific recombinase XerD
MSDFPVPKALGPLLTAEQFHQLAAVPTALEWFANIDNPCTRRAYQGDLADFSSFVGIQQPSDFRKVSRAHVIAWRTKLEGQALAGSSIRRKLAALSSLFEYLCEKNAVDFNPVKGAKRPKIEGYEGKTPALGDDQARSLLNAPDPTRLKGKRDRAILSTFLYHGLRRAELCRLQVGDIQMRRGVQHLQVHGKGGKLRYVPLHPNTATLIDEYLQEAAPGAAKDAPFIKPMRDGRRSLAADQPLTADGVYKILRTYAQATRIDLDSLGPHSLRATAATNALDHEADIAKVQEWLGHANIATTRIYDRRHARPEHSPTFKISY